MAGPALNGSSSLESQTSTTKALPSTVSMHAAKAAQTSGLG
eukprot:CAMPEP_0175075458 /NCGR_PEP_ID=MMETSP0052_2-20121109/22015_1 /TAXON_ID=51329 ORGANISM="Polytomella parva, Strain SAG 63-3" /NCGR_SAMPLE_ID=MMETSP0052_2 /ASSEMBLY_ACC=CAM_ASM_000194 /LENGTH=40 /DNA_ID= /DNA_START= /DNA_END= /DNA_ORIENTATION=